MEVEALRLLRRWGAAAVYGRVLGRGEMLRLGVVEELIEAYLSRERFRDGDGKENWALWAQRNPALAEALESAQSIRDGEPGQH